MIQIISTKLETTATPSRIAEKSVAPKRPPSTDAGRPLFTGGHDALLLQRQKAGARACRREKSEREKNANKQRRHLLIGSF